MQEFDRSELVKKLEKGILTVLFIKKDGTLREMKCTLMPSILPAVENKLVEENRGSQPPEEVLPIFTEGAGVDEFKKEKVSVLSVWDIEKSEWRSFRMDSIKEVRE